MFNVYIMNSLEVENGDTFLYLFTEIILTEETYLVFVYPII